MNKEKIFWMSICFTAGIILGLSFVSHPDSSVTLPHRTVTLHKSSFTMSFMRVVSLYSSISFCADS